MTPLFIYYLKASVALALFYAFYRLMFDRDTFFSWKRALLIGSIALSVIYPFIDISTLLQSNEPVKLVATFYINTLPEFVVSASPQTNWWNVPDLASAVWMIYLAGVIVFAIKMLTQLGSILNLRRKGTITFINNVRIIALKEKIAPFSFFKWIFVNPDQHTPRELNEIMAHEQTHVSEWHSVDVLFCQLAGITFWFNPFVWLIQSAIRQNLEYLADHRVIRSGYDSKGYQYHLLRLTHHTAAANLGNNFNVSELKKRIIMMNTKKSSSLSLTKYVLVVPLAIVLLITNHAEALAKKVEKMTPVANLIQAVNPQTELRDQSSGLIMQKQESSKEIALASVTKETQASVTKQQTTQDESTSDKIYVVTGSMPEFQGGQNAMHKFIGENIKYPADAQLNGITGTVIVQFVVRKTGEITDVTLLRGIATSCDNEALRVVKMMPKWIPGKHEGKNVSVKYIFPIHFALDKAPKQDDPGVISLKDKGYIWVAPKPGAKAPLVLIDGKERSKDKLEAIDVNKIKNISVLKDEDAIKAYGEKAKNGVIVVEMKKE